jgi:ribosomal protein S11
MSPITATYISINSTYNNTSVTIHKSDGLILFSVTAGALGFKKSKRSTSYAAQSCGERVAQFLSNLPRVGSSVGSKLPSRFNTDSHSSVIKADSSASDIGSSTKLNVKSNLQGSSANLSQSTAKKRSTRQAPSSKGSVSSKLAQLYVCVNGVGTGKYSVIRGLIKGGVKIKKIVDVTSIPHNGCRPPKQRRL